MEVEIDPRIEELLELETRRSTDSLDQFAATADHDWLLRRLLDDDRAVEAEQACFVGLVESIDDNGRREWQLGVGFPQQLFAHDLGCEKALGLVRKVVIRIERLSFRKVTEQNLFETVHAVPCKP